MRINVLNVRRIICRTHFKVGESCPHSRLSRSRIEAKLTKYEFDSVMKLPEARLPYLPHTCLRPGTYSGARSVPRDCWILDGSGRISGVINGRLRLNRRVSLLDPDGTGVHHKHDFALVSSLLNSHTVPQPTWNELQLLPLVTHRCVWISSTKTNREPSFGDDMTLVNTETSWDAILHEHLRE